MTQNPRACLRSALARSGAEGACPPLATTVIAAGGTSAVGFSDGAGVSSCDAVTTAGAAETSVASGRVQHVSAGPASLGIAQGAAALGVLTIGQQQPPQANAA